jgi:simple sugar transport system ATP-binding protein
VRRQLLALRERGKAVLLVSEDLEEIFELADRIAVMYGGRLVGMVDRERADLGEIGLWMAGSRRELFAAGAAGGAPQ